MAGYVFRLEILISLPNLRRYFRQFASQHAPLLAHQVLKYIFANRSRRRAEKYFSTQAIH